MPSSACRRALRSLHSFPTRRSSDLRRFDQHQWRRRQSCGLQRCRGDPRGHRGQQRRDAQARSIRRLRCQIGRQRVPRDGCRLRIWSRSEEHTSELQSLRHLVCRLLLAVAPSDRYTLSLHDALPIFAASTSISGAGGSHVDFNAVEGTRVATVGNSAEMPRRGLFVDSVVKSGGNEFHGTAVAYGSGPDRKSTRLNSSHLGISYAVFCLPSRPPIATLFPYTTLFRSSPLRPASVAPAAVMWTSTLSRGPAWPPWATAPRCPGAVYSSTPLSNRAATSSTGRLSPTDLVQIGRAHV